jgi:hypothetical protein
MRLGCGSDGTRMSDTADGTHVDFLLGYIHTHCVPDDIPGDCFADGN